MCLIFDVIDSCNCRDAASERPEFCARNLPEHNCEALVDHPTMSTLQKNNMIAIT